jgi:cytochrome c
MMKLDKKLLISLSAATLLSFGVSGCMDGASPAGSAAKVPSIDGGVMYPVQNGMTGPYRVNEKAHTGAIKFGRTPTEKEYEEWNTDVMADGTGLPEGEGSVEDGEEIYESKCVMCHGDFGSGGGGYPSLSKGNAYDLHKTLTNQRIKPDTDGPVRVFGTYWPQASTLWWYIKDAMPHPMTGSLSDDEVYALVAYILNINEMEIDGVEVDDEYVLNREKFLKIKMPNRDGFEP